MYLIWVIARREFTENIFSLRLFIGLIVCFALFVSSTYVLTEDYEKRLSVHNAAEIEHRNTLEEVKVYSYLRVDVAKPPEPYLRRGGSRHAPLVSFEFAASLNSAFRKIHRHNNQSIDSFDNRDLHEHPHHLPFRHCAF